MATESAESQAEVARLVKELESAEAYEQKLRQIIVDVREALAAGNTANALSMLNQALSYIDDATDVVTSAPRHEAIEKP
jgi:ribosomal protein S20